MNAVSLSDAPVIDASQFASQMLGEFTDESLKT